MLKGSQRLNLLFHPNINGHEAWAQSLLLWSRGEMAPPVEKLSFEERVKAKVSSTIRRYSRSAAYWAQQALVPLSVGSSFLLNLSALDFEAANDTIDRHVNESKRLKEAYYSGSEIKLHISELLPGQEVAAEVRSQAQTLGVFIAAEDGTVDVDLTLPQLSVGTHHLVLSTHNTEGELVYYIVEFEVRSGLPLIVAIIAGVTLLLAVSLCIILLRRRKWSKQVEVAA